MLSNNDKRQLKTVLEGIPKSSEPDTIIQQFIDILSKTLKVTDEHIDFAASYFQYLKGVNVYQFNTKRKSVISNKHYFEKYTSSADADLSSNLNTNLDSSRLGGNDSDSILENTDVDVDSNSDNFRNVDDNIDECVIEDLKYEYPKEIFTKLKRDIPYGTQPVQDRNQVDDNMSSPQVQENLKKFIELRKIESPPQRSEEWHSTRRESITASDGGVVTGDNKYEQPYEFIVKKTRERPFGSNKFCYHGTKYEEIATMIYEYRMNVKVDEFGLLKHPTINFLAASPDGICSPYKLDKIHLSNKVGRMLEIKCPLVRKIIHTGEIKANICPIYYWVQVQLQLECCDLEECDFWQANIKEYSSREEFLEDTDPNEPFRSISSGYEKGCIIQYMPSGKIWDLDRSGYWENVYAMSKFVYPPRVDMTPCELDTWVAGVLSGKCPYEGYVFDRIWYWKIVESNNTLVKRDRAWFQEQLPVFDKMWKYVLFFRENKEALELFDRVVEAFKSVKGKSDRIMEIVDIIFKDGQSSGLNKVEDILAQRSIFLPKISQKFAKNNNDFTDSEEDVKPFTPIKLHTIKQIPVKNNNDFTDSEEDIPRPTISKPIRPPPLPKQPIKVTAHKSSSMFTDSEDD